MSRSTRSSTNLPSAPGLRIESLLQSGKTKEAIALAEKANLVCQGAAFIAWDEAEEVAIAQDEVYQPSLEVPSGVACSMPSTQGIVIAFRSFLHAWGGRVAFMPATRARVRESFSEGRPSSFKNKLTEWWNAILAAGSDVDLEEPQRLTAQLNRVIESVFRPDDAKKLTSIVLDWVKHADDQQVEDTLRVLLRECDPDGDARFLYIDHHVAQMHL